MSQPTQTPPQVELPKKDEKKNDEKRLRSFTIRVEESVLNKLMIVGERAGDNKIARIARNYLRLAATFILNNNRMVGYDGKELALIPVEMFRSLIKQIVGTDENAQIDLGNEFGKYLKSVFYLDPRKTVAEKVDFIQHLGWFSAKRDPATKQALIPTDFAPELFIQAMIYQIMVKKEMPRPPSPKGKEEKAKDYEKRRNEWAGNLEKEQMAITKNVETEIGFDAFSYE